MRWGWGPPLWKEGEIVARAGVGFFFENLGVVFLTARFQARDGDRRAGRQDRRDLLASIENTPPLRLGPVVFHVSSLYSWGQVAMPWNSGNWSSGS